MIPRMALLAILALGVFVLVVPTAAPAAGSVTTAHGFAFSMTPAGTRTFAFAVSHTPQGATSGFAFVNNPNTGLTFSLWLNCLIRQDNEAIVGGVVTTANNPAILGWSYVFGIEDNPDVITFTLTNGDSTLTCANALDATGEPTISSFVDDFAIPNVISESVTLVP
jgi:hypothetical protein